MNPVKKNELIDILSNRLNIDIDILEPIINQYWKDVFQVIYECKEPNIFIPGLGTLYTKTWILDKKIEKLMQYIAYIGQPKTLQAYKLHQIKHDELNVLLELKEKMNIQLERKKNIRQLRHEFETKDTLGA